MRYWIILWFSLLITNNIPAQQNKKLSKEDYINKYKDIAIAEMKRSGIPASITIAQGMLESDNGNGKLTSLGNNHFGIKCHNWDGKKFYIDDDIKNECFRKYGTAAESFHDHTDFLLSHSRYSFLFGFKSTDYKDWAKGLKKAGYATNPLYAELLVKIIEENKLNQFDHDYIPANRPGTLKKLPEETGVDFTFHLTRPIFKRNDIDYVIVKKGDNIDKLAREVDNISWELIRYNELTRDSVLHEGQIIYLEPKHRRAEKGMDFHTVQAGESVYSVSQLYGMKTRLLRKWNNLSKTDIIHEGDVLNLRSRKKR
jgi:LysM repeat protein